MNAAESVFSPSFLAAQSRFLSAAARPGACLREYFLPVAGPDGARLALWTARLGDERALHQLAVISGTHGVEGFCGSAIQTAALQAGLFSNLPGEVSALFIHALNPYGFAWLRRVNEQNVDINRNFVDFDHPPGNPGYDELASAIAPPSLEGAARLAADARLAAFLATRGLAALQAAIQGGQYRHPDGLFYGGCEPSWSRGVLETICREELPRARRLIVLDFHSGLGAMGEMELISPDAPGSEALRRAHNWFGPRVRSEHEAESVSAALTGEICNAFRRYCPESELTFLSPEFGTREMHVVFQALRADNWAHRRAIPFSGPWNAAKTDIRDAFYPDSAEWRARVLDQGLSVIQSALDALAN
ncbi:MAG: hypothetical protein GMKNLPBB_02136 [Myxococcota bacterium]|nr:hypothetical protein [Myxococcota bacterium]